MGGSARAGKWIAEMGFNAGGGVVNWFPGHMAAATRAIRDRLKLADLVIEVRDARIPLSSANQDLQGALASKRRIIALNKKDLANPNIMHHWIHYFDSCKQDCLSINAHSRSSISQADTADTVDTYRFFTRSIPISIPILENLVCDQGYVPIAFKESREVKEHYSFASTSSEEK